MEVSGTGAVVTNVLIVIDIFLDVDDDVIHILETRISDSWPRPFAIPQSLSNNCSVARTSQHGAGSSTLREKKKGIVDVSSCMPNSKMVTSSTITRRGQVLWACRFILAEGKFDSKVDLIGVVCQREVEGDGAKGGQFGKAQGEEDVQGRRALKQNQCFMTAKYDYSES